MEIDDKDPRPPAERRGPQVGSPARAWMLVGWIISGVFVLAVLVRACTT